MSVFAERGAARFVVTVMLLLMFGISAWTKFSAGADTNLFVPLAFLHCFGLPLLALVVLVAAWRSHQAVALLALGAYIVPISLSLLWATFAWGSSDNSFILIPFEAGLTLLAGLGLILLGAIRFLRASLPPAVLARGLGLALAGALLIVLWLVWRGPGDWASGSEEVRLYSFPILLDAVVLGWMIYYFSGH